MATGRNILIVDDDQSFCQFLRNVLEAEGYHCKAVPDAQSAEAVLREEGCDVALIDIYLQEESGLDAVSRVKSIQPDCECVMMTAQASLETVTHSVAAGALEYLSKPILIPDLLALLRRIEQRRKTGSPEEPEKAEPQQPHSAMVGKSAKMLEVYRAVAHVAPTDATVLISGPSGTGKELVARAIHQHSKRASMPFVAVNCAAIPETMLESEFFGHEKGAFTGAASLRRGLFESSKGGTLFLDEIGETSAGFQVKMLRVLQDKEIRRLGSNTLIPIDVRILSATNADLAGLVREKKFREDLYYRLSVVHILMPSLAERRDDIPLLVRHFLNQFNHNNKRRLRIPSDTVEQMARMDWPGNVRELQNVIERAAIFAHSDEITMDDVEHERTPSPASARQPATAGTRPETLRETEKEQILRILREVDGNRSLAARRLGIERKTLYNKAKRLGIDLGIKDT